MTKKPRMMRTFARTAPKSQEKYLVENAKKLRENPYVILPDCPEERDQRYFHKLRKQFEKIHRFGDNEEKLEKFSNKKGLDGALAGSLLLAISEKAPYLGVMKFSIGDITYAQRGKADKEKLIAVQHFDDPILRLLGIRDLVSKKKLHVFSWDNGFICTGREAAPPKEFVDFIKNKIGFIQKNEALLCPHITLEQAKKKEYLPINYLRIDWKPAQTTIAFCESCAKSTKNTMFTLSKYMVQRNLSDDFDIDVMSQIGKHRDSPQKHKTAHLAEYLSDKLSDYDFIKKNARTQEEHVQQKEEKILVLNGVSYGSDVPRFVDALHPNQYEKTALEYVLEKIKEPVIVTNLTPNKILEKFWVEYGKGFIQTIIPNTTMAESFFQLDDTPSNIVKLVFEYQQRQTVLSQLPQYAILPPLATFIDTVARTYKTFGEKNALLEIKKRPDTPKGKTLAYTFLLAFGKGVDTKWQYSKEEIEYGEFLQPYVKKLLTAGPQQYSAALQEVLSISGSSEVLPQ